MFFIYTESVVENIAKNIERKDDIEEEEGRNFTPAYPALLCLTKPHKPH